MLLGAFLMFRASAAAQQQRFSFAIQPLGDVDRSVIDLATRAIADAFGARAVTPMSSVEIPAAAYYAPRKRYRAEKILEFLDRINRGKSGKVIGLTSVDISTAKGRYEDWGIFGMANIGGPSCIISTYRLGRGKGDPALSAQRIKKAVIHELGHALGLPHCTTAGCVMRDAEGKISTIDRSDGRFCPRCERRLGLGRQAR
jgi:archaemetzincin